MTYGYMSYSLEHRYLDTIFYGQTFVYTDKKIIVLKNLSIRTQKSGSFICFFIVFERLSIRTQKKKENFIQGDLKA